VAGRELTVDMRDDDLLPAWQTVIDVASTGIAGDLTLVGGLMVATHGRRAGVMMRRSTDDMDALVDYWADRSSLTAARVTLARIGFDLVESEQHAYRFMHSDGRKVDIMVADHLPSRMRPRLAQRAAFAAPAGEQAIRRRDVYTLIFNGGARVVLACVADPSELAYETMSANDRRRLRAILEQLGDDRHSSWANLDQADRERGLVNASLIESGIAG